MSKNLNLLVSSIDDQLLSLEKTSNIAEKIQKSDQLITRIKKGLISINKLKQIVNEPDKHSSMPANVDALLQFTDDIEAFDIIRSIVLDKKDNFNENDNILPPASKTI